MKFANIDELLREKGFEAHPVEGRPTIVLLERHESGRHDAVLLYPADKDGEDDPESEHCGVCGRQGVDPEDPTGAFKGKEYSTTIDVANAPTWARLFFSGHEPDEVIRDGIDPHADRLVNLLAASKKKGVREYLDPGHSGIVTVVHNGRAAFFPGDGGYVVTTLPALDGDRYARVAEAVDALLAK